MLVVNNKIYSSRDLCSMLPLSAHYEECVFTNCSAPKLVLAGQFRRCSFLNTDLSGAVLSGCIFIGCNFTMTKLRGARFRNCRFLNCRFARADFTGAKGLYSCFFGGGCTHLFDAKGILPVKEEETQRWLVSTTVEELNDTKPIIAKPVVVRDTKPMEKDKLPVVSHYRSPPDPKAEVYDDPYKYDDDEDAWAMAWHGWCDYEPRDFGYGSNAVLECPDIEEYKGCV